MSVRRVMGTEVEYGISAPGNPAANPMLMSAQVVNAYAAASLNARRARWDYEEETPLRDARGFDLARHVAHPSQLTDTDDDPGMANVVLTNGARLYVDHAHPEYSGPEVTTPLDVVRHERAGELVMADAARLAERAAGHPILLYKNNTDNKGASYGAHENYLMDRATPFPRIVEQIIPFFVSRPVVCGAGRVGLGQDGRTPGFQISQRADFFEVEVGLETTLKRPLVNTRDEPHADAQRYRRLHVIVGDANLSEVQIFLKAGTTSLVLAMIEAGALTSELTLQDPVGSLHRVSHDPTLQHLLTLSDGRRLTAVQLQWEYHDRARKYLATHPVDSATDPQTEQVMARWESVLTRLEADPTSLGRELDWVAKLNLMEQYHSRDGLAWDHPKLALVDLQYADIRPEKGLHHRLVASGRMERLLPESEVVAAMTQPPLDTRAYFRGRCLSQYPESVQAASWDSVIFDVPGRPSLQRVPTSDPWRGTEAHVGALMDRCANASDLLDALGS